MLWTPNTRWVIDTELTVWVTTLKTKEYKGLTHSKPTFYCFAHLGEICKHSKPTILLARSPTAQRQPMVTITYIQSVDICFALALFGSQMLFRIQQKPSWRSYQAVMLVSMCLPQNTTHPTT